MTILVLEDNPPDQTVIRDALSGTEHTLLQAENLDDALEQLSKRHIDAAILSLSAIPERAIPYFQRLLTQAPSTKVVALAPAWGGDGLTTLLRAESLRAHHLLAKPIDTEQLLALLQPSAYPVAADSL